MNIIIKNVTGSPVNMGLIMELSKAGFPEGSKIWDTRYSPGNNSCEWSSAGNDCIAYPGETCEELPSEPNSPQPARAVRYMVINSHLYMVPEHTFVEFEKIRKPNGYFKPEDVTALKVKIPDKLESIMETCPVGLPLEGVYNTCDFW